jgi:hypothetical protein
MSPRRLTDRISGSDESDRLADEAQDLASRMANARSPEEAAQIFKEWAKSKGRTGAGGGDQAGKQLEGAIRGGGLSLDLPAPDARQGTGIKESRSIDLRADVSEATKLDLLPGMPGAAGDRAGSLDRPDVSAADSDGLLSADQRPDLSRATDSRATDHGKTGLTDGRPDVSMERGRAGTPGAETHKAEWHKTETPKAEVPEAQTPGAEAPKADAHAPELPDARGLRPVPLLEIPSPPGLPPVPLLEIPSPPGLPPVPMPEMTLPPGLAVSKAPDGPTPRAGAPHHDRPEMSKASGDHRPGSVDQRPDVSAAAERDRPDSGDQQQDVVGRAKAGEDAKAAEPRNGAPSRLFLNFGIGVDTAAPVTGKPKEQAQPSSKPKEQAQPPGKEPECLPIPGPKDQKPREFIPGHPGTPLTDIEARTRAALEALNIQSESVLGSILAGVAALAGIRDPERLRDIAMAGYALEQFAGGVAAAMTARQQNQTIKPAHPPKDAQHEQPLRTAQTVVQEKVTAVVNEFHRDPTKLGKPGLLSERELDSLVRAVHEYRQGAISVHELQGVIGRTFGKAVERETVAQLQKEGVVSIGQSRDAQGRFKSSPDVLFKTGQFAGEKIEITTAQAWAAHVMREWGGDVGYALYEVEYPNLMRFLTVPR